MKVVTSAKYEEPTFESGMIKLTPIRNGSYPEFVQKCKWVDRERNLVWLLNGITSERILLKTSIKSSVGNDRS